MSPLGILLVVFLLVVLLGNPIVGTRIHEGYSLGYWPGGLGLIVAIVLLVLLLR